MKEITNEIDLFVWMTNRWMEEGKMIMMNDALLVFVDKCADKLTRGYLKRVEFFEQAAKIPLRSSSKRRTSSNVLELYKLLFDHFKLNKMRERVETDTVIREILAYNKTLFVGLRIVDGDDSERVRSNSEFESKFKKKIDVRLHYIADAVVAAKSDRTDDARTGRGALTQADRPPSQQ